MAWVEAVVRDVVVVDPEEDVEEVTEVDMVVEEDMLEVEVEVVAEEDQEVVDHVEDIREDVVVVVIEEVEVDMEHSNSNLIN